MCLKNIGSYTAHDDGAVTFSLHAAGEQDFDVFAFTGFGAEGVCNPDACVAASTSAGDTSEVGGSTPMRARPTSSR